VRILATSTLVLAVLLARSPASAGGALASHPTHCGPDEQVQFSCRVHEKVVSLCARAQDGQLASLTYRYGVPGHVENAFEASAANGHRFFSTAMPASPGALVRQVWFDRGDTRYLLTDCVGGECGQHDGLAVLRSGKLVMRAWCEADSKSPARFLPDLVRFGRGSRPAVSLTPLVILQETDNLLQEIYPPGGRR
jgi:hypothetical protein